MVLSTPVRGGVAAFGMAALVATSAAPASANDMTLTIYDGGVLKARGTYDDLTDNLCITVYGSSRSFGEIAIAPTSGWYDAPSASNVGGAGRYCTGNMSIPEDRRSEIQMRWRSATGEWKYTPKRIFYT